MATHPAERNFSADRFCKFIEASWPHKKTPLKVIPKIQFDESSWKNFETFYLIKKSFQSKFFMQLSRFERFMM